MRRKRRDTKTLNLSRSIRKFAALQVATGCKFDEKRAMQQSQNLLLKVDPRSTFHSNFLQPATKDQRKFLLRDKLITQDEKRETSTKTSNEIKRDSGCIRQ